MSDVVEWEAPDLDPSGPGTHARKDHAAIVKSLKERPGEWAVVRAESAATWAKPAASALASNIRSGRQRAYLPVGDFEAIAQEKDGMLRVYARFIGAVSQAAPLVSAEEDV